MNPIWQTLRFTVIEILQMRAFRGLLLIVLLILPLAAVVFSNLFLLEMGKVRIDTLAAGERIIAALYILVIVVSLIGSDIARGTSYLFLTPPNTRRDYLIGRFLGVTTGLFILMLCAALGGEAVITLSMISDIPTYRHGLDYGNGALLAMFVFYQHISVLAAIMFICVWATGTAEMMVFSFGMIVLAWSLPAVLQAMQSREVLQHVPESVAVLLKSISYLFPKLNGAEIALALGHGLPITGIIAHVAEHSGYALFMFGLALYTFSKRDL
ncbi:hypothetical protein ACFL4I_00380 [Pseudomonadota bacterium]